MWTDWEIHKIFGLAFVYFVSFVVNVFVTIQPYVIPVLPLSGRYRNLLKSKAPLEEIPAFHPLKNSGFQPE
jgi:hypothetical protein